MKLIKSQGTGNDFIIYDEIKYPIPMEYSRDEIAKKLCHREMGIGADGVLYVLKSNKANAMMRIFNADGSEALMCGNGLRCFSRYIMDTQKVDTIDVETLNATYHVRRDSTFDQYVDGYEIVLNNVEYFGQTDFVKAFEQALESDLHFSYVTVSNPHIATLDTKEIPTDDVLKVYGELGNKEKAYFAQGINVNFATILADNKLYVRTYERGVGITKSCGTGMTSAVTTYAIVHDKLNQWVEIYNDGGKIMCYVEPVEDHYSVKFVGNATNEFQTEIDLETLMYSEDIYIEPKIYLEEAQLFEAFYNKTRQEIAKIKYENATE